jgi:hypothetical protein
MESFPKRSVSYSGVYYDPPPCLVDIRKLFKRAIPNFVFHLSGNKLGSVAEKHDYNSGDEEQQQHGGQRKQRTINSSNHPMVLDGEKQLKNLFNAQKYLFKPEGDGKQRIPLVVYTGLQLVFSTLIHTNVHLNLIQKEAENNEHAQYAVKHHNPLEFERRRIFNAKTTKDLLKPFEIILGLLTSPLQSKDKGALMQIKLDSNKIDKIWHHTGYQNNIVHTLRNYEPMIENQQYLNYNNSNNNNNNNNENNNIGGIRLPFASVEYFETQWPSFKQDVDSCFVNAINYNGFKHLNNLKCIKSVAQSKFLEWQLKRDLSLMDTCFEQLDNFIMCESWPFWQKFVNSLGLQKTVLASFQLVYTERNIDTLGSLGNVILWPYFVWFLRHQVAHWISCCDHLDYESKKSLTNFLIDSLLFLPCSMCSLHTINNGAFSRIKLAYEIAISNREMENIETLEWSLHNQINHGIQNRFHNNAKLISKSRKVGNQSSKNDKTNGSVNNKYMTFEEYKSSVVPHLICFGAKR